MIRTATPNDAQQIAEIYNHYITKTVVTFETLEVESKDMAERISQTLAEELPYLVYLNQKHQVVGYAYASKWKGRCAYQYSVETTVYLSPEAQGCGIGTSLCQTLISQLTQLGYHAVIAGISLPNPASVALHEKLEMKKVAHFEQVGFKFEEWVDVGYWQLVLK